jgi:hypothetical protein
MAVRNVAVVVDRAFSDRLSELARLRHVWVVESPTNTAAIRDIWQGMSAESCPQSGVTSFEDDANQSAEELCADIVGVVDEHHGEFSSDPPWSEIDVFGVALTPALRTVFEGIGSSGFESTTDGFVCRRATEAARKGT